MRKILIGMTLLMASSSVYAAHGPAGCGLGSILFAGKSGLIMNVLAATFNATSANQTFGMSTGTLGCEDAKTAQVAAVPFIRGNSVALANDIAQGGGETLTAYLNIIERPEASRSLLQQNFDKIFAKNNDPQSIHNSIMSLI